ncbi:T9SS type A sorting domain-containing protein, partial [bacterium]|nr:T9SS type A sorting domain-containing protein [bacterium]
ANVDTAWYNDGLGDVTPRSIDAINSGVGFYLYRGLVGHGLQQEHINNLQNAHMTPVVLDITCNTGDWASSFSISEAYMRSGTVNNPTGGIGAFSTATSYTLTRFNNALAAGAVEAAFRHKVEHLGDLVTGAKLNLWHNYQGHEDEQVENFSTWFNLMGDPTISFWTAIPRELTVEAPESLPLGRHSTTVRVMDSDGEPIENAWVTLYKTENQQPVVSRGISDFRGLATLAVDFAETGEITLTVSAQNYRPHQQIIQSQQAESDLEIVEFIVDDSNGNDNGIAESGEDILLKPVLRNSGNGNYADILVSYGFIDHPWYIVFNGELTIPAISAGEEIVADSGFFIGISPDLKDQHSMPIPFSLSYEAGIFHDTLFQTLSAPQLIFDGAEISEPLNPGAEATVRFRLKNIGHASSSPGEIVIGTQDQYLEIETEYNGLGEIGVGEIVLTPEFILRATGNSILGHMANVYLNAFDENGAIYRIEGQIPLGERSEYDPAGPDGRGYYAFDQVDQDYAQAPIFEWIEISPQAENPDYHGMVLDIQDYTRNQDDAVVMELPFTFRFYGERFNQVTITSNGYIALGDQAHLPTYRNWRIPAPLGPDYIIAPFWDDRRTSGGGHVVWYDDEAGNRVIIQWTGMTDFFDQNPCTFQLILYDRVEGHTTPTHDNEFLFQYSTLNPSDGHEEGNRFYTTGIQNGDHSDGLLLAYWNEMFPGTARIDSGSAILFTTRVEPNFWKLKEQQSNIPSEFSVLPAWPNPFNSTTNIRIALPEAADLTYHLYNILGEVVSTRELGHFTAGHYSIPLTPQSTSSGIYFVTLEASGRQINVQKLVLLK